jgi:hypothetical protein
MLWRAQHGRNVYTIPGRASGVENSKDSRVEDHPTVVRKRQVHQLSEAAPPYLPSSFGLHLTAYILPNVCSFCHYARLLATSHTRFAEPDIAAQSFLDHRQRFRNRLGSASRERTALARGAISRANTSSTTARLLRQPMRHPARHDRCGCACLLAPLGSGSKKHHVSGCVSRHRAFAALSGSMPTFAHHAASSPHR